MGFGNQKIDIMHALNGMNYNPEFQCRLALNLKDHEYVSFLSGSMPSLTDLVTKNSEFLDILSNSEQQDILSLYFRKFFDGKEIHGQALTAIISVLCRNQRFHELNFALEMGILNHRETILFFLNYQNTFMEVLKAEILNHLDITQSLLAGRSALHILAETGRVALLQEIIAHLPTKIFEKIERTHFTKIEGNSILHSAVLSNEPEMIREVAKNFNCLCGHLNAVELSPLKLSLVNENSFESIKVLFDHGCFVDGEKLSSSDICEPYSEASYFEIRDSLLKMEKCDPFQVKEFSKVFLFAYRIIDSNDSPIVRDSFFMGLINSYRKLITDIDRIIDDDYSSSSYVRSTSFITEPGAIKSAFTDIWSLISSHEFDPLSEGLGLFRLSEILHGMHFNIASREVKKLVLNNLAKISPEFIDYSEVNLGRFINILITYGDPELLAQFVDRDIDYYFCVRTLFKQFNEYEDLVPFLNAIMFSASKPFVDGLYPIHLAVTYNNLDLIDFLITKYEATFHISTLYHQNNVLHYGLTDKSSSDMTNYLLNELPNLIMYQNTYDVIPLEMVVLNTGNFELLDKVTRIFSFIKKKAINKVYVSEEVKQLFNETLGLWPLDCISDQHYKESFISIFLSCGSNGLARLLLGFISKKLLKNQIKGMVPLNSKLIMREERKLFQGFNDSPAGVVVEWSP